MPTPKRGPRLGGSPANQKLILANQAKDLFRHGRITTTLGKAKTLRPYAEKLITKAKAGDLHSRRQVLATLNDKDVTHFLFEDIAPRFADRPGGYTRILKLGPRPGDNAPMAIIELVDRGQVDGDEVITEGKASRGRGLFGRRRKHVGQSAAAGAVALADHDHDHSSESSESSESSASSESSVSAESVASPEEAEVTDAPAPVAAAADVTDEVSDEVEDAADEADAKASDEEE